MNKVAIIGAGPAGLTAGYLLAKAQADVTVFEEHPVYVGGISRTEKYKGFHFDIGGHRFFSKSKEVEDFWTEILGDDMLHRPRKSRIFYKGKFYSYPLKAMEALTNLGMLEAALCILSYAKARMFPVKNPKNFEDWVSNQFGRRLFNIFFKTYTEKVWGMSCREISADWAAQRIKGLSLTQAIYNALFKSGSKTEGDSSKVIKTLIDSFRYPRKGPGMMWEVCAQKIIQMGGRVEMGTGVRGLYYNAGSRTWRVEVERNGKKEFLQDFDNVISSMPMRELVRILHPSPDKKVQEAAEKLKYRDFLTVMLILEDKNRFDDNWIYIHDPNVKVGRVQNFKSWSPEMIPDPQYCCYGLEYFCFEGDGLWTSKDEDLIELAKTEIEKIGIAKASEIVDGCVVRQKKAYPVYDDLYRENVRAIKEGLQSYEGLYLVGRNGMHKYNNQDHSMMTAMLAARNILAGQQLYDVWNVNEDAEYHEAGVAGEESFEAGRQIPKKVSSA
ncbi:MAG: protoporphyrinogen oxidase [Chitinophagales bacterium]|nr:MAG: protoporphyrinogen oxidase [Chitinophagales bacterium]